MRALIGRIKRLEKRRKRRSSPNRVVLFNPEATTAEATLAALNVGNKSGKPVLLVASWNSDEAWRAALRAQQRQLIGGNKARPYTPKHAPSHTTPEHEDVLAPGLTQRRALPQNDRPEGGLKVLYRN